MDPRTFSCNSILVHFRADGSFQLAMRRTDDEFPLCVSRVIRDYGLLKNLMLALSSEPGDILDLTQGVELQHQPGKVMLKFAGWEARIPNASHQALAGMFAEALGYATGQPALSG